MKTGDTRHHDVSQQATGPRVGRIISIEGDSADEEGEGDENAVLVQLGTRKRTESDSSLHEKERLSHRRLADIDQDNALSEHEFTVAMKLVLVRRRGYDIPSSLPDALRGPPRKDPFSDSFLPPQSQSLPPPSRPPPPSVLASKGAGEPSRPVRAQAVSYTHLTLPTNREV